MAHITAADKAVARAAVTMRVIISTISTSRDQKIIQGPHGVNSPVRPSDVAAVEYRSYIAYGMAHSRAAKSANKTMGLHNILGSPV